jgi:hypothetical protein
MKMNRWLQSSFASATIVALFGCGDVSDNAPSTDDGVVKQVDGKSDAWNWRNNPSRFRTQLNYKFSELPGEGASDHVAWAATYWPYYQDGINARWQGSAELSPAEKYDKAFGGWEADEEFMSLKPFDNQTCEWDDAYYDALGPVAKWTAQNKGNWKAHNGRDDDGDGISDKDECEHRAHSETDGEEIENEKRYDGVETWWGICHAWAPAALMEKEPLKAVTRNGVTFDVSDIKGLLISQYDQTDAYMVGGRCNDVDEEIERDETGRITNADCRDLNAGTFHVIITNFLGVNKRGLVIERTWDYEVWNQPLVGYQITSQREISVAEAHALLRVDEAATGDLVHGIAEDSRDATAVLALANDGSLSELEGSGLDARTANNIVEARPYTSLSALDAVDNVGERGFAKLKDYANAEGFGDTSYAYNRDATRFIEVEMTTDYITESHASAEPMTPHYDRYVRHDNYHYVLELNARDEVIGGEWVGDSIAGHPDFFWLPVRARGGNPNIDTDTVRSLVAESRSEANDDSANEPSGRLRGTLEVSNDDRVEIPDNDPVGATSTIHIDKEGPISDLKLNLKIEHTYRGDVVVELRHGGISMKVYDGDDVWFPWVNNVRLRNETVDVFAGSDVRGDWELVVYDTMRRDVGALVSWSLEVKGS